MAKEGSGGGRGTAIQPSLRMPKCPLPHPLPGVGAACRFRTPHRTIEVRIVPTSACRAESTLGLRRVPSAACRLPSPDPDAYFLPTPLKTQLSECSQFEHSKVWRSNPRLSGSMRANSIGVEQLGHRGCLITGGGDSDDKLGMRRSPVGVLSSPNLTKIQDFSRELKDPKFNKS